MAVGGGRRSAGAQSAASRGVRRRGVRRLFFESTRRSRLSWYCVFAVQQRQPQARHVQLREHEHVASGRSRQRRALVYRGGRAQARSPWSLPSDAFSYTGSSPGPTRLSAGAFALLVFFGASRKTTAHRR